MAGFAKYDGIDGESNDAHHNHWVDVLSLDWGAHRPSGGATGQSRRRGSAIVEDLVLTIEYEKAAPKVLEKCLRGEVVPSLVIEFTATYGGTRTTYLKYELTNVMVTSYHVNASGNDEAGPPIVTIANSFEKLRVIYTEYDDTGASAGNVETNYKADNGREVAAKKKQKKRK